MIKGIMGLPNLLPFHKDVVPPAERFFALELDYDVVKAAVWTVADSQVKVEKTSDPIDISGRDHDALLHAVDMAIATATESISGDIKKVIFGLPEDWVDSNGITPEKRKVLSFICKKLELTPLGFVVTLDALVAYLQQEQGTPPSAVFIRMGLSKLLITLVQLGKVVGQETIGRSEDIVSDVKEGLMRLKNTQFPARIILYNGHTDFEDVKQQLLAFSWEKELQFFHTPKIDNLPAEATVSAIAIAGGKEAAKSLGLEIAADPETEHNEETDAQETAQVAAETPQTEVEEKIPLQTVPVPEKQAEADQELVLPEGFTLGNEPEPVAVPKPDKPQPEKELPDEDVVLESAAALPEMAASGGVHPVVLGVLTPFARIGDSIVALLSKLKRKKQAPEELPEIEEEPETEPEPDTEEADDQAAPEELSEDFDEHVPSGRTWLIPVLVVVGLLIVIAAGAAWFYWTKPKAVVTLAFSPQYLEKEVEVSVSTDITGIDTENLVVPGLMKEMTVNGSQTVETTGSKRVGEKATGTVIIYNKTNKSKSFSSGTVLTGPDNLRFVLSEQVSVASASSSTESITFGKSDAKAVAGDIGEEYNVDQDSQFSFKDFGSDQYSAKAKENFTGGKSIKQRVVAKEDQKSALEQLMGKLETEAQTKIQQEAGGDIIIFSQSQAVEMNNETYDFKVGAEAENLTAEADLNLKVLTAVKRDFEQVAQQAVKNSVPDQFMIANNGITTEVLGTEQDNNTAKIRVKVKAKLMPRLDFVQVKANIVGKEPAKVEEYFKLMPNYSRTKMTISPALPGVLGTLPRKPENISITVEEAQ